VPVLTGALTAEGAIVSVMVGLSGSASQALRAGLRPVAPPVSTRAILDSGAEMTCVDPSIIQVLGLPFGGTVLVNLPAHGGMTLGILHDVSLTVVHPSGRARDDLVVRNPTVLEVALASLGYDVLIGRDVLAICRFLYHGPRNRFHLAY
jgi:hypothetical protein